MKVERLLGETLRQPGRVHLHEGTVQKVGISQEKEVVMYLFNNLLIYGEFGWSGRFNVVSQK